MASSVIVLFLQLGQNRSQLAALVNFLLAVFRRAESPSSPEQLAAGGFLLRLPGGREIVRNPAGPQMAAVLPNLLVLAQTLNKLFHPDVKAKLDTGFNKAFDLLEVDKNNVLGLPGSR